MTGKLLAIALTMPDIWDAGESAALLMRMLRAADRSLNSGNLVQFPWVDGSHGTLDFLVTHTLGSFLEVEASSATGEGVVAPIGFTGEDGKLAVIEMACVASVAAPGERGTTAGIGELIQDALDEGAFSIVLCHEEPLAFDAGMGAAAALGVRFFDAADNALDVRKPGFQLTDIHRIDASGRTFALLSSRLFIAQAASARNVHASKEQVKELKKLANIIRRDTGISGSSGIRSASGVEFGLTALLGAEVRDGIAVVLEASLLPEAIERGEFSAAIILAPSQAELESESVRDFLEHIRTHIPHRAIIIKDAIIANGTAPAEPVYSLAQIPIFQAPLRRDATRVEHRRDVSMRLEKIIPNVLTAFNKDSAKSSSARHA